MSEKFYSLNEHICNYITQQIFSGKLLPGERINENILCEALKVSRTPIREALIQLSVDGIIDKIPRKGFAIKKISIDDAKEIYQLIGILEAEVIDRYMNQVTSDDLKKMRILYTRMKTALVNNDIQDYKKYQNIFHSIYVNHCPNKRIVEILEKQKTLISMQTFYNKSLRKILDVFNFYNEQHKEIIEYFETGNKKELIKLIKDSHWNIRYESILKE